MKASLSWLKTYVPIDTGAEELAEALTMGGLEVESVTDRFDYLKHVRVGRVIRVRPHPNAEKLKICDVDTGGESLTVVCGAPNAKEGMISAAAFPGTRFPDGTVLREAAIRGIVSQGMLCSEKELGLGNDAAGILELKPSLEPGQNLAEALQRSDPVLEISVTPNRPDCLGLLGIAREIAGIRGHRLAYPDPQLPEGTDPISTLSSVVIETPAHCPRYAARLVFDVTVGPSPFWLQDRLLSVGLRPVNNIVDITNFVLMETGQPLHAFDFDRLAGHRIVVKTAQEGERFVTLDGKERLLGADTLMICDGEKGVAVAGVMGGLNSEITASTTRVFIESAYFNPVSIRRTAKRLGVSTEASHRFEREVDPDGVLFALDRAAALMADIGGGTLIRGWIDAYPKRIPKREITVSLARANRLLGTRFTPAAFKQLLESIEFRAIPEDEDRLRVHVPSFRVDVKRPEDLMEEAARLAGYQHIPVTFPVLPVSGRHQTASFQMKETLRRWLTGFGFLEAITYSFIDGRFDDRLGLPSHDFRRKTVEILNPLSDAQRRMRTTLIPGLLGVLQRNLAQQIRTLRLFETGKVYLPLDGEVLPRETEMLALLWTGYRFEPGWYGKETPCDFFDMKGVVEGLLKALGVQPLDAVPTPADCCAYLKPGYSALVRIADREVGWCGAMQAGVLETFDVHQAVFIAELNLDVLLSLVPRIRQVEPISRFPKVARDFTLIVDKTVPAGDILRCVTASGEKWVKDVHLFDVFEKAPIPPGKKSVSFRITYQSTSRTLEEKEVSRVHQKISTLLLKTFDAMLPA